MRSSSKLQFEISNISTYQDKNKLFNLHLTMAGEINKKYKSKLYKDIIEHVFPLPENVRPSFRGGSFWTL